LHTQNETTQVSKTDLNIVLYAGYKSWNMAGEARWSASDYSLIWPNSLYTICQCHISSSVWWEV